MIENKCRQCGKDIGNVNTFCNSSCAAKYNNTRRKKKPYPLCKNCGKELSNRIKVFCNNKCQAQHRTKTETLPAYYRGEITQRGTLRRILNEERGHVCNICGLTDWNGKQIILEVSHIDGDPFNNMPSNLELVCPNCHSQSSTYKGRNRGNGRKLGNTKN